MRYLKIFCILSFIILALYISPKFLSEKFLDSKLDNIIMQKYDIKISAKNLKLSLLFMPKITMSDAYININHMDFTEQIHAQNVSLYLKLLPLFRGKFELYKVDIPLSNIDIKKNQEDLLAQIKNVSVNAKFTSETLDLKAKIDRENTDFRLYYDSKNLNKSTLEIISPIVNINFKNQKFFLETSDINNIIEHLLGDSKAFEHYLHGLVKIAGNYEITEENAKITEAKIEGENMNGHISTISLDKNLLIDVNVNLEKINLEKIEKEEKVKFENLAVNYPLHININSTIGDIAFNNESVIKNFSSNINLQDKLTLKSLSGDLSSGGSFILHSDEEHANKVKVVSDAGNIILQKFFAIDLEKEKLEADFLLAFNNNLITLEEIEAKYGDIEFGGQIILNDLNGFTILNLNTLELDLDKFKNSTNITKNLANYIFGPSEELKKFLSDSLSYTQKNEYMIAIKKLKFQNNIFNDFYLHDRIYKGNIDIINLNLNDNENININITSSIDTIALKPILATKITGQLLDTKVFSTYFGDNIAQAIQAKFPQEKNDYKFILPNLDQFEGYINISLARLKHKDLDFENFILQNILDSNKIILKDGAAKVLDGQLNYYGSLQVNQPSFAIYFSLGNTDANHIVKKIFNVSTTSGPLSLGGFVSSAGYNTDEIASNLALDVKFIGKNLKVITLGADTIAKSIASMYNMKSKNNLQNIVKWANSNGVTSINDIEGRITGNSGNLTIKDTQAISSYNKIDITGNLNLPHDQVNVNAAFSFKIHETLPALSYDVVYNGGFNSLTRILNDENIISFVNRYIP